MARALTTSARRARLEDATAIRALIGAMGGHDDILKRPALQTLGALTSLSNVRAFVAERDGEVIGYAEVQARPSSLHDRFEGWLGALAVAPNARRSGAGRVLLEAVEREARALGCSAIVLESSQWRGEAHEFYEALAFVRHTPAERFSREIAPVATLEERFLAHAAVAANDVLSAIAELHAEHAVGIGADGAPTEAADRAAEAAVARALAPLGIPILSEESGVIGADRIDPAQPWISLDPLDGSRNYRARYQRYATSMALVARGRPLAGFVCDLTSGRRWSAVRGSGAFADGTPLRVARGQLAGCPSPDRDGVLPAHPEGIRRMRVGGSTALDLAYVADGSLAAFTALARPVVHVHDLAAALLLIEEAGGVVVDRDGKRPHLEPDAALTLAIVAAADEDLARAFLRG